MEKDALCDMNEGLRGMKGVADGGWSMLVWGRGGWKVGRVKWYIGLGVWFGYGASGRLIRRGVVEKLGRQLRCVKGRGDGVGWARPGSESLRGGQKSGLDLCRSNNIIRMGGEDGQGRPFPCGT